MEVHAHTHTARKRWTHYFWEFIMLFLAVFCGFLAEYQLEHKIEKERARKYMYDMVENLKYDTIRYNRNLVNNETIGMQLDSFRAAISVVKSVSITIMAPISRPHIPTLFSILNSPFLSKTDIIIKLVVLTPKAMKKSSKKRKVAIPCQAFIKCKRGYNSSHFLMSCRGNS